MSTGLPRSGKYVNWIVNITTTPLWITKIDGVTGVGVSHKYKLKWEMDEVRQENYVSNLNISLSISHLRYEGKHPVTGETFGPEMLQLQAEDHLQWASNKCLVDRE